MKYNVKLEDIIKKYPFMYEVNGKIYHIGNFVFKECDNQIALEYFNNYKSLIDRINRNKFVDRQLDETETEELVYYFRKIIAYSDIHTIDERNAQANEEAIEFITTLSDESKNNLFFQLENYIYSFWYYTRSF